MTLKKVLINGLVLGCVAMSLVNRSALSDLSARQKATDLVKDAQSEFSKGKYGKAILLSRKAIRTDPTYLLAYTWLGSAYARDGKLLLSRAAYEEVIILAPNSAEGKLAKARLKKAGVPPRIERSLLDMKLAEGHWSIVRKNVTINGQVFARAGLTNAYNTGSSHDDRIVFSNPGFDLLEVWIGKQGGSGGGTNVFEVIGNGQVLYTSPAMSVDDPAIQARVPIKGYSGITILSRGDAESRRASSAVWADPVFVKSY
jgi:hypothetical protein